MASFFEYSFLPAEREEDLDLEEIHRDCELWMESELEREARIAEEDLDLEEIHREGQMWMDSEAEPEFQREANLDAEFEAVWAEYLEKKEAEDKRVRARTMCVCVCVCVWLRDV